jgi:hypothetical protein
MRNAKTNRHQNLRRLYEASIRDQNVERFMEDFRQALEQDRASLGDRYSVRELFEQFVPDGREAVAMLAPTTSGGFQILESAELVDTSQFANILGQITYTATLNGYNAPEYIGDQLVETIPTVFSGERIPGVGRLGDDVDIVAEGGEYPNAVFGEEFVDTPETIKRGLILNVTREAIFFDRTGVLMSECGKTGERVRVSKEKRIFDVVCGIATIYRRNGAAAVATYQSENTVSNTLADFTSIDTVEQKFNTMSDPITGEPISIELDTILVPKALSNLAGRIMAASQTRSGTNSGNTQTYVPGNSVNVNARVLTSPYVRQKTTNDTTWFAGRPREAFVYMQNWPLTVTQAGENSEVGFTRDIVVRYKTSERGAAGVRDRLKMCRCT